MGRSWLRSGKVLVISFLLLSNQVSAVSDFVYEQRLSDSVADSLVEGEAVWLKSGRHLFLSVFLEAETAHPKGGVLILTGIQDNADSVGPVRFLRREFAARGWAAMSLQMPVRNPGFEIKSYLSLVDDSGDRVQVAMNYLAEKELDSVVLIGHDLGGWMAVDFLKKNPKSAAIALVLVGMPVYRDERYLRAQIETLKNTKIPVLDLYGSRDLESVVKTAGMRRSWMKKNKSFRQLEIAGADHEFRNDVSVLFKRIYGWLTRYAGNTTDDRPSDSKTP